MEDGRNKERFQVVDQHIAALKKDIYFEIKDIKNRADKVENMLETLRIDTAINQHDIKDLKEDLNSIKSNTNWILRLLVGSIILALLSLIIKSSAT